MEQLCHENPRYRASRMSLAKSHRALGLLAQKRGDLPEARREFKAALAINQDLAAKLPDVLEYRTFGATVRSELEQLRTKSRK
jgi:hypothetical protein